MSLFSWETLSFQWNFGVREVEVSYSKFADYQEEIAAMVSGAE
jgi:hypothetical protein